MTADLDTDAISFRSSEFAKVKMYSSRHESSCAAMQNELAGKLVFDDTQLVQRLKLGEVNHFTDHCLGSFWDDNADAIAKLKDLEAMAEGSEQLSDHRKRKCESAMRGHLHTLFKYIEDAEDSTSHRHNFTRTFLPAKELVDTREPHTAGFPNVAPAFSLVESNGSQQWKNETAFCKFKMFKQLGPNFYDEGCREVGEIVCESADYARLHISTRPFLLFSVGLLIFGSDFCVGIFDRDGVTFSPIMNLRTDTKDFIRIVRSLTRVLTAVELGHDPSVTMLPSWISAKFNPDGYPSFRVASIGSDPREWCTLGPPMWSSLSLFGRGTSVWSVLEYKDGAPPDPNTQKVMKTAWRNPLRHSEAEIYRTIKGQPPAGLAEFLTGADVTTPNGDTVCIAYLRGKSPQVRGSAILHRIILNTVGRPMWTYTSDLELLKGMEAAGRAHKFLSDQQIIHGDISPGNILLAKDSTNAPTVGFLADLELAQLPSALPMESSAVKSSEGDVLSGTLLFAATERLEAFRDGKHMAQTADHDVESFVLALEYTVMRKLLISAKDDHERRSITKALRHAFGHTSLENIITSRSGPAAYWLSLPLIGDIISREVSEPLRKLLGFLGYRIIDRNAARVREQCEDFTHFFEDQKPKRLADIPLNHSIFFSALSVAIGLLEGKVEGDE